MSNSAAVSPKMLASPKIASPARVRHNPYGSPTSTPIDAASSLADSFATHPPQTPPMAAAPAATPWPTDSPQQRPVAAGYYNGEYHPPADPQVYGSFDHESMMGVGSFSPQPSYYSDVPAAYDAVDPSVAVAMYSAASAAAANAAAARVSVGYSQPHPAQRAPKRSAVTPSSESPAGGASWPAASGSNGVPRFEDVQAFAGSLIEHARTASGSSFIQTAVKESNDPRCLQLVWAELSTALGDLLLDAHGCYVIKTLLERLPADEVHYVLGAIAADEQLGFSICTHSLHTRRVVQHIIENVDGNFLCELMARHCADVAMTQQGCIVMQRSMDNAPAGPARDALFAAISANLVNFAKDPFANYVVQHVMEVGERIETTSAMWKAFRGRVVELACNKFASNVVEKCLFHCTAEIQHEMLAEMYSVGPQMLYNMLQDSFGNYIIQSSIALATFRDISMIDEALRPVLAHTPYGHKIEARLDRRLKGKPVSSRGPAPNASPATAPAPVANKSRQPASSKGRPDKRAAVPAGEVPW